MAAKADTGTAWDSAYPAAPVSTPTAAAPSPPPPSGAQVQNPILRELGIGLSGVAKGAGSMVDTLAKGAGEAAWNDPSAMGVRALSGQDDASQAAAQPANLPGLAVPTLDRAGITDRADLQPQGPGEKFLSHGAEALGAALPFAPILGLPSLGWAFGSGGSGGVLGDYAQGVMPEHPVLAQTAGNVIGGLAGPGAWWGASRAVAPLMEAGARAVIPGALGRQAASRVAGAMRDDIAAYDAASATGMTPGRFEAAAAQGIAPFVPEDAENTRALAGSLMRSGGPAKNIIKADLRAQDAAAPERVSAPFGQALGTDDIHAVSDEIAKNQARAAGPLYEAAFAGGSTAPLQTQLRTALQTATGAKGTLAKEIAKIEREKAASLAARGAAGAETRARYLDLRQQLAQAEQDRIATLDMFKKAQADATANAPGAVWSPRIQQFLDDPIMKGGLRRGLQIQRLESLAAGKRFNPTEYAITGADEAGNPIVGSVPNMRLLDAGKRGLDAIIADERNSITGKLSEYGRAVNQVRVAYLKELDAINPDYAAARAAWSGPAQSLDAIREGARALTKTAAEIKAELAELTPGDRKLYRLSAMQQAVAPKIEGGTMGSNEAGRVLANTPEKLKPALDALFPDDTSRLLALQAAKRANLEFQAKNKIMGGSDTAERIAADRRTGASGNDHSFGALAGLEMLHGEPTTAAGLMALRYLKDVISRRMSVSPALNAEMARLLTARDAAKLAPVLKQLQKPTPPFLQRPLPSVAFGTFAPQLAVPPVSQGAR